MPSEQPYKQPISVGEFFDPKPNDQRFIAYAKAYGAAARLAEKDSKCAIAVWVRDKVDRIYFGGHIFTVID